MAQIETDIAKLVLLDKRIFYDPERRTEEEGLQNAIARGTQIIVSGYCLCDLDETRLKKLLEGSQTKFVGLRDTPNMCGSRKFIERCGKIWIEAILPDEQYAAIGGMNHEEYQEAWRKKREIEREINERENIGKAKSLPRITWKTRIITLVRKRQVKSSIAATTGGKIKNGKSNT